MEDEKRKWRMAAGIILIGSLFCFWKPAQVYAQQQKICVGTNAEYAPFEYLDSDGNLTGFDYELLEAIAEAEDLELE